MNWQPVYIDNSPYYFPLGSIAAYIDYVVTDQRGVAIRQGQLNLTYQEGPEPPVVVDDCDVLRPLDADLFDPEYDPNTALSLIRFRMVPTIQGLLFQYNSQATTPLSFRFKVSTIFHIPGEFVPLRPSGFVSKPITISMIAAGQVSDPSLASPVFFKYSGVDASAILGETINDYKDNVYIIYQVEADSLGNIYVMGESEFAYPAVLVKYSSTGEFLWQREFTQDTNENSGDNYFYKAAFDADDNIIVAGTSSKNTGTPVALNNQYGDYVGLCVKYDPDGNEIFAYTYGSTTADVKFYDVVVTPNAVFLSGSVYLDNTYDGFTMRIDPNNGDIVWITHLHSTAFRDILMHDLELDSSGDLLQMGKVGYGINLLRKYDAVTGAVLFTTTHAQEYYTSSYYDFSDYAVGSDGSIYHVEVDQNYSLQIVLTKFNANGVIEWQKNTGFDQNWYFYLGMCTVMASDNFIHVVWSVNFNDDTAILISDFDFDGTYVQTRYCSFAQYGTTSRIDELFATYANGFIYVTFMNINSYPDTRKEAAGVFAIPAIWNGVDEIVFQNDALRIRPIIPFSVHDFTVFNVDTLPSVTTINDPFTSYLGMGPLTEDRTDFSAPSPQVDLIPDYEYYRYSFGDPTSPLALSSTVIPEGSFAASGGNFWASRQATTIADPNTDDFIIFDPEDIASDSAGNVYSIGHLERRRLYTGTADFSVFNPYVMKHSSTGDLVWLKLLSPLQGTVADYDVYGHIAVDDTGFYTVRSNGGNEITVAKWNSTTATVIWSKGFGTSGEANEVSGIRVEGSTVVITAYNRLNNDATYIIRLNATSGAKLNEISKFPNINGGAQLVNTVIHKKRVSDGQGFYYNLWINPEDGDYGYIVSKHSDADDAFIWQRRGRFDSNLKANPTSQRIDIEPSFTIDPSGNVYISATIVDFRQFQNRNVGRRLLIKYDSTGTMVNHKIYRVNMENGKPTIQQSTYSCDWIDGKLVSITKNSKFAGSSVTIDVFDADLNPIWGRVIHQTVFGFFPNWAKGCPVGTDGYAVTFMYDSDENLNFVIKLPIDGEFAFQGLTGLHAHACVFVPNTEYTLAESASTHFTEVVTPFASSVNDRDITGLVHFDYTDFYEQTTPI